jgi:hypothetical protein
MLVEFFVIRFLEKTTDIALNTKASENISSLAEALGLDIYQLFLDEKSREWNRVKLVTSMHEELKERLEKELTLTAKKYLKAL